MATFNICIDKKYQYKDNTYPVRIKLWVKNAATTIETGINVAENQWDKQLKQVVGHPKAKIFNKIIQQKTTQIDALLLHCSMRGLKIDTIPQFRQLIMSDTLIFPSVRENHSISFERPEEHTIEFEEQSKTNSNRVETKQKKKSKVISFTDYFKKYVFDIRTASTKEMYQGTLDKVEKFLSPDGKMKPTTFEDVNCSWLKRFEMYLVDVGLATNTRSIHLRNIRKVFNSAIDENLVSLEIYPFRRFKIKTEETKKRVLELKDFLDIKNLKETDCEPYLMQYRDIFMLMFYLVGINIKDLVNLKEISKGRIEYRRAKTRRLYSIKVEPEAMEILEKYKGKDYLVNILDRYHNHKDYTARMNKNLKKLHPELSTYYSRYTWATIASKLDIPKDTIAAALGHGRKTVTDIYIDFDRNKIDQANRMVIDYLKNMSVEDANSIGIIGDKEME